MVTRRSHEGRSVGREEEEWRQRSENERRRGTTWRRRISVYVDAVWVMSREKREESGGANKVKK